MTLFTAPYPDGLPIGEGWIPVDGSATITFPYTGEVVAEAPVASVADAELALAKAAKVAPLAAKLGAGVRRQLLIDIEAGLRKIGPELEQVLILETGKPLIDCQVEVARTLSTWSASAEEVAKIHGETVPVDLQPSGEGMIAYWTRRPAGPILGIAGFNYPILLATHKIAPALAAGCPVICKPAPTTPLASLMMMQVIRQVLEQHGLPGSLVQLVTGDLDVGQTLVGDPRMAVVSFTGSAAVGHQIARDAAPRRVLLELGSNTGFIVAKDADLGAAASAVIKGGFYANGQACISVQRIVVEAEVAEAFERELVSRLDEIVVGDPRDPATRVAPLIDQRSTDRVLAWVAQATADGARLVAGGGLDGRSLQPTVLATVPSDSDVWAEEIFGPVVCLQTVASIDAAIDLVNDSRYGLHAAIYTSSLATAFDAIERLEVGGVVVNQIPGFRSDIMPYGGVKDSGIGREGPRFAIEDFTVTKMAMIKPIA